MGTTKLSLALSAEGSHRAACLQHSLSYIQMLVVIKQVGFTNGPCPSLSLLAVHSHCCLLFIMYQRAKFDYCKHHFEGRGAVAQNGVSGMNGGSGAGSGPFSGPGWRRRGGYIQLAMSEIG